MSTCFNAQHSPVGAFASFTLGQPGACGGLGLEIGKPADQNVYIGVESADGDGFEALPFFKGSEDARGDYVVDDEQTAAGAPLLRAFGEDEIQRDYALCTDTWRAGDLTFTVYSPTWSVPDPDTADPDDLKKTLIPAVFAELTIDNRTGQRPRRAFFGYTADHQGVAMRDMHTLRDDGIVGIAAGATTAIVTDEAGADWAQQFTIEEILAETDRSHSRFRLGQTGSLEITVAPTERRTLRFVLCFHRAGIVTTGLEATYLYTRFFPTLEAVAQYGLDQFDTYRDAALEMNRAVAAAPLSESQRFQLVHAAHSYFGSTQLLELDGRPFWVVNEGEYRMMNTFDLTADHLFYELRQNPWTVRNELDMFVERYSYTDQVFLPGETDLHPGGISFTHDMGVANNLSPAGCSSYELPGLDGCFSYMTCEQLVNWVCCASCYVEQTGDDAWLARRLGIFERCLDSLVNRDHPDPDQRNGIMGLDSSRTDFGAEITTYDSLDQSLGQARNNGYMAIKGWAAYLGLARIFAAASCDDLAELAGNQAELCAATLISQVQPDGTLPAVLFEGTQSRIISVVEGLVFAYFNGCRDALQFDGPFGAMLRMLRTHLDKVLVPGCCLFEDGGWKLSSTSTNSWLSKIYLAQFVARKILGLEWDQTGARADDAHANWLLRPENTYWAWSDQCHAGIVKGSRFYPRGVTSTLWLDERG